MILFFCFTRALTIMSRCVMANAVSLLVEEPLGKWALRRPRTDGSIILKVELAQDCGQSEVVLVVLNCYSGVSLWYDLIYF
jgi:hypothetical protein